MLIFLFYSIFELKFHYKKRKKRIMTPGCHGVRTVPMIQLANFSQVPPISANFHLCSTNLDLFRQLFHLHDLGVVWCSLFENILFWLYFLSPFINSNFFCGRLLDFCYIFVIYLDFFVSRSKL